MGQERTLELTMTKNNQQEQENEMVKTACDSLEVYSLETNTLENKMK